MNGIRYWRLKRRMTYTALAREAGCNSITVRNMERNFSHTTSSLLVRVADALDVTVDQLVADYPEDSIVTGDHPEGRYTMATTRLNPVGRYCRTHNISLIEYAALAGKRTKQSAQYVWVKPKPKRSEIEPLARREGLTLEAFLALYLEEVAE